MAEIVEVVQRRHEILAALEDGARAKPGLTDATPSARSTIDRGIDELIEVGLVCSVGSEYELTAAGERVIDAYQTFRWQTTLYGEYAEVLHGLRSDDEFPALLLDGADVVTACPEMPTRPVKRGHEGLAEADSIYSICPVLLAFHYEFWQPARPETDVQIEVVYSSAVLETMEEEYPNWREDIVEPGLVTPFVNDDLPSYEFAVVDGLGGDPDRSALHVLIHDEDGDVTAFLQNESAAAVEWGRERFQRIRSDAKRVR